MKVETIVVFRKLFEDRKVCLRHNRNSIAKLLLKCRTTCDVLHIWLNGPLVGLAKQSW
jgi:hypothetical protein